MEWGEQLRITEQNSRDALYHNPNYVFERINRKKLILDVDMSDPKEPTKFHVKLMTPMIIDKLSDIFIENFITFNAKDNNLSENMAFVINIDQFNINTDYGTNILAEGVCCNDLCGKYDSLKYHTLLIPNETKNQNVSTNNKGFKSNFVCSINPTKISEITGTITGAGEVNDNGVFVYNPIFNSDGRFILQLQIINV